MSPRRFFPFWAKFSPEKASAPIHSSGGWGLLPGFLLHGLFPAFCGVFRQKGPRLPIHKAPGARGTLRRADHLQACASSWGFVLFGGGGKDGGAAGEGSHRGAAAFLYLKGTILPPKSQVTLCEIHSFHNGVPKNQAPCTKVRPFQAGRKRRPAGGASQGMLRGGLG